MKGAADKVAPILLALARTAYEMAPASRGLGGARRGRGLLLNEQAGTLMFVSSHTTILS